MVRKSPVLGIPVIEHRLLGDDRGPFGIPIELPKSSADGLQMAPLEQLNYSRRRNGAFGIHVSNTGKYCFVLPGTTYHSWVVDLRDPQSPTFGQSESFELTAGTAIYVPSGYGNAG